VSSRLGRFLELLSLAAMAGGVAIALTGVGLTVASRGNPGLYWVDNEPYWTFGVGCGPRIAKTQTV
jgi:hypothetical protein